MKIAIPFAVMFCFDFAYSFILPCISRQFLHPRPRNTLPLGRSLWTNLECHENQLVLPNHVGTSVNRVLSKQSTTSMRLYASGRDGEDGSNINESAKTTKGIEDTKIADFKKFIELESDSVKREILMEQLYENQNKKATLEAKDSPPLSDQKGKPRGETTKAFNKLICDFI